MNPQSFSLDWRFLPHIPVSSNTLLVYPQGVNLSADLTASMDSVTLLVGKQVQTNHQPCLDHLHVIEGTLASTTFELNTFDLIAFPDGLGNEAGVNFEDRLQMFKTAHQLLGTQGILYLGFPNRWSYASLTSWHKSVSNTLSAKQAQKLLEHTGFRLLGLYGLIPNHRIPHYIFSLQSTSLYFSLNNYWKRTKLGRKLSMKFPRFMVRPITRFLPGYGIIAIRQQVAHD